MYYLINGLISAISGNWQFTGTPGYGSGANGRTAGTYAWIDFSGTDTDVIMEVEDVDVSGLTAPALVFDYYSDLGTSICASNNTMHVEAFDGTTLGFYCCYRLLILQDGIHMFMLLQDLMLLVLFQ